MTVIDARDLILGRMASTVAKRLLQGETIDIINAEQAIISGRRAQIINEAKEFLSVKGPRWGPIHHRSPHMIIKRTIRGMLPYRKHHGREAYDRLRVHNGTPPELSAADAQTIQQAHLDRLAGRHITIGEVAESIGWKQHKAQP